MNTITDDLIAEIENEKLGKTIHHEGCMYYPAKMVERLIGEIRTLRADAALLDGLDRLCEGYGTHEHEGNEWKVYGPFSNVRDAIDTAILAERQK
tara:strand:+ start:1146 stop:1430 length:285 start_codon:yes stop_codon:yes gene_type:complete